MAERYTQNRGASVSITGAGLADDDLLLKGLVGVDRVSQPYHYVVQMLENVDAGDIKISKLIGRKLTVTLDASANSEKTERYFHGYIADIRDGGASGYGLDCYYASVVPWFWFLKKNYRCRIFRNKSVDQILEIVFKGHKSAFTDFEMDKKLSRTYPLMEHCVQYQESDFAFASRLMEEFGISYYFEHEKTLHKMVLLDSSGTRPKELPGCAFDQVIYDKADVSTEPNTISSWERRQQVVSDMFEQSDFNFANKSKFPDIVAHKEETREEAQGEFAKGSFGHHVHEGIFIDDGVSEPYTEANIKEFKDLPKVRLASLEAERELIYAESFCRGLHCGYQFKLTNYTSDSEQNNKEYYVIAQRHQIEIGDYVVGSPHVINKYMCKLTAIPKETEFHPPRLTPRSRIYGPQTAIVVREEKSGKEEVFTDELGRVKVSFYWDREADRKEADKAGDKKDEVEKNTQNYSCWVRVAQGWAGNKFGSFFLPRVGQEVIVEFLDGDPDRPIITGSVYNGRNLTPYKLPEHKTISTIKTQNLTDKMELLKESNNFNEIRFEDLDNKQQIFIHAARSMDSQVLGDQRQYIGGNLKIMVDGDDKENEKIKGKSADAGIGNRDVTINKGNDQLSINEGDLIQNIAKGGYLLKVKKNKSVSIGSSLNMAIGDEAVIGVYDILHIKAGGEIVIESDDAISIKAKKDIFFESDANIHLKAKKDILMGAGGSINETAKSYILSKGSSGVSIAGGKSSIDLEANAGIKGGTNVVIKGAKVDINGSPPATPGTPSAPKAASTANDATIEELEKAKVTDPLRELEAMKDGKPKDKEIEFGKLD